MYLLQPSLFSFEDWLEIDSTHRVPLFFGVLDLEPYALQLRKQSPKGAKPINREAVLRTLLVAPLEGISTFTRLHERLARDIRFRYQCGFRIDEAASSVSTLSRVFSAVVALGLAEKLFVDLVSQCKEANIISGQHLAVDSAAIKSYEKKQPKSKSQETGNANWGAKYDTFGNKLAWFGYKFHLAVDTVSELPVALEDIRRYCAPHRGTQYWKLLYNERTAVERCNSRLKTNLTANDVHVRGIQKVKTHVFINAIVLLVSALAVNEFQRQKITA